MYSYFSNPKFEPSHFRAKCQQEEMAVKKAIMYYESSPLKNSDSALAVCKNTIAPKLMSSIRRKQDLEISFNPWSFVFLFSFFHIQRMRLLKNNLNEMEYPFFHILQSFIYSSIFNIPVSIVLTKNYSNKKEINKNVNKIKDIMNSFVDKFLPNMNDLKNKLK